MSIFNDGFYTSADVNANRQFHIQSIICLNVHTILVWIAAHFFVYKFSLKNYVSCLFVVMSNMFGTYCLPVIFVCIIKSAFIICSIKKVYVNEYLISSVEMSPKLKEITFEQISMKYELINFQSWIFGKVVYLYTLTTLWEIMNRIIHSWHCRAETSFELSALSHKYFHIFNFNICFGKITNEPKT